MYEDLAAYWPVISPPEGYRLEAAHWRAAFEERLGPGTHSLLELGVGGGHNLHHLKEGFAPVVAVDLSEAMLENSRALNPDVEHHVGDMREVRLGRVFDAVAIHDAVAYMRSEDDLARCFVTAARHLRPGGAFVTTPDHVTETYRDPQTKVKVCPHGDGDELTYFEYCYDPDPADTEYETLYTYLFRRGGGPPEVHTDTHVHGLFPKATWLRLLDAAGFDAAARPYMGSGAEGFMFVATRRG